MMASTEGNATAGVKSAAKRADQIGATVASIADFDRKHVLASWHSLLKERPPDHLPTWLLRRVLAYRAQAATLGDLDRVSIRLLDQVADERERRKAAGEKLGKKPPRVPVVPSRRMKPGTILVREYDRQLHRVTATASGFQWKGKEYRSLTEVAFAITGTRWNGPRFFGLRAKRSQPEAST